MKLWESISLSKASFIEQDRQATHCANFSPYVKNTMYFETSDLKIHFLMIRNSEIPIKHPYAAFYSRQNQ